VTCVKIIKKLPWLRNVTEHSQVWNKLWILWSVLIVIRMACCNCCIGVPPIRPPISLNEQSESLKVSGTITMQDADKWITHQGQGNWMLIIFMMNEYFFNQYLFVEHQIISLIWRHVRNYRPYYFMKYFSVFV
jgi:hypothetical protein